MREIACVRHKYFLTNWKGRKKRNKKWSHYFSI